jgi:hypothetical protein
VPRRVGVSWDEDRSIVTRAVRRGLTRRHRTAVPLPGLDEKSFIKRHQYVSALVDLETTRSPRFADDRNARLDWRPASAS